MEAVVAAGLTLRAYLTSAAQERCGEQLKDRLAQETSSELRFALDCTYVVHSGSGEALPRPPWTCGSCLSHTELIHHAIECLLSRKRANWEDSNILTLGYQEATPGSSGHRVAQSNGIVCHYPNTLVALLKKPLWESLHQLMGDDLMLHLLLNYTIVVQLRHSCRSYMQLAGKSLRYRIAPLSNAGGSTEWKAQEGRASVAAAKRNNVVSISQVLYARRFEKKQVFTNSHELVRASKKGDPISRGEASRVLGSIFPEVAGEKRLPKRLLNLVPIVQSMVARFKACNTEELARKLVPVPPEFRKFMHEHPEVKHTVAERNREPGSSSEPLISPMVDKALNDGYLSQDEEVVPSSDRKRKRREEAIESLSHASAASTRKSLAHVAKKRKRQDLPTRAVHVDEGDSLAKLQQHKEEIKRLLAFATPKCKIYRLVRKLVARVMPKEIWGSRESKKNWKCVKQLLRKFIFSRKFDVFSLKKCAEEMQVTTVEWMNTQNKSTFCPPNERVKRQKLLAAILSWMLSSMVFPLLRNLFFITEAEGMANEISYYQRSVWDVISSMALDDLDGGILRSADGLLPTFSRERQLTASRLRLLPKTNGIRPLMNLSAPVGDAKISVNRSLETVHRVLSFELDRHPKRLVGAAVRNLDEVYNRLKPLLRQISTCERCAERHRSFGDPTAPMAYCISVDIERCFDTIRPRKLYQMLKKALGEEEYLIRKHWVGQQVSSTTSSRMGEGSPPPSSFFFKMERPAFSSGDLQSFETLATQSKKRNAVFIDGVLYDYLTRAKALELLKEHLFANVVQIDGHEYVQQCGIPQGSVLSTTLCNMYYAHFERRVLRKRLPEVCDPSIVPLSCCQHEDLLRYTDDFLYITTDLKRAQRFSEVMHRGNEEYGCFVNLAKSQANFLAMVDPGSAAPASDSQQVPRFDAPGSGGCLSWCGMLIDPVNLQIYVNYDKLSTSLLQTSIPFNETKAAQTFFVNKVVSPFRQRWHPLYFDPELLSVDTIKVNLFQMLCLAARRFVVLVEMLPFVNHDMRFLKECVSQILAKTTKGIHRNLQLGLRSGGKGASEPLTKKRRARLVKQSYRAQKHQVWTIGLLCFRLVAQAKRDAVETRRRSQASSLCSSADWQKLMEALTLEQDAANQQSSTTRVQAAVCSELDWLLQDPRNTVTLQQCLLRD